MFRWMAKCGTVIAACDTVWSTQKGRVVCHTYSTGNILNTKQFVRSAVTVFITIFQSIFVCSILK